MPLRSALYSHMPVHSDFAHMDSYLADCLTTNGFNKHVRNFLLAQGRTTMGTFRAWMDNHSDSVIRRVWEADISRHRGSVGQRQTLPPPQRQILPPPPGQVRTKRKRGSGQWRPKTGSRDANQRVICKKFNDSRGCMHPCPRDFSHCCDVLLATGEVCAERDHGRRQHDAERHGEPQYRRS